MLPRDGPAHHPGAPGTAGPGPGPSDGRVSRVFMPLPPRRDLPTVRAPAMKGRGAGANPKTRFERAWRGADPDAEPGAGGRRRIEKIRG